VRLSELRPCDCCGGAIARGGLFFRLQIQHHVLNQTAARQSLAMEQFFGGSAALRDAFDAFGDKATEIANEALLLLCTQCFTSPDRLIEAFAERVRKRDEARKAAEAST